MLHHEYRLQPDHTVDHDDYLPETLHALATHDFVYDRNPSRYFEQIDLAKRFAQADGRPYLLFRSPEDSVTDLMIAQLPFANRLHPANSAHDYATYANSQAEKLPKGLRPNSASQAIKHHLAYTAILGVDAARDEQGRTIPLAVVASPAADFHQPRLDKSQRKKMKQGNFQAYAAAVADIAEELDVENLHLSGYSFGASVAAQAARIKRNFNVKSLTIGEPTTHIKRTTARIMGDYTVLDAFNSTSGDKSLEKIPDTGWLQDGPKARRDIARHGDGVWLDNMYANGNIRTNLQIARALGKPVLRSDISQLLLSGVPTAPLTVLYAADSLMTRDIEPMIDDLDAATLELGSHMLAQALKVTPVGAVAAKHIVGEIPALYADYLARGIKHAYTSKA